MSKADKYDFDLNKHIKILEEKIEEDFSIFYTKNYNKLVFHNRRYISDPMLAEEIASDAFIKALKIVEKYDNTRAKFTTWLYSISQNDCLQHIKQKKRNPIMSIDRPIDDEGTTIKDFLDYDPEMDIEIQEYKENRLEKGSILRSKIPELKEPYRNVINLREVENYSYRYITILLREQTDMEWVIEEDDRNYNDGILTLVDPEKKKSKKLTEIEKENIIREENGLPLLKIPKSHHKADDGDFELVKLYSLDIILNEYGEEVDFEIVEYDKDGLITKVKIAAGRYFISSSVPFQMSTLKSQIRNGRKNLQELVEDEFNKLERSYIH